MKHIFLWSFWHLMTPSRWFLVGGFKLCNLYWYNDTLVQVYEFTSLSFSRPLLLPPVCHRGRVPCEPMIAHINDLQAVPGCNWKASRKSRILFLLPAVVFALPSVVGNWLRSWQMWVSRVTSGNWSWAEWWHDKTECLQNGKTNSSSSHKDERRSMSLNFLLLSPP